MKRTGSSGCLAGQLTTTVQRLKFSRSVALSSSFARQCKESKTDPKLGVRDSDGSSAEAF